ncbi:hypothetical protein [Rosettibacter firmus]|uniref:hypothetical protein n=1 Tax=Rosettibacter firmus TaxID=3111522 RepID=UPI00336C0C15
MAKNILCYVFTLGYYGIKQSIGGIKFDINYSYSATEYFDGVNRFSLSIAF